MITYTNVTKRYGSISAVSDLTMTINSGEFYGLLGPNGAGKTTVMRMTSTLTPLTDGRIEIDGETLHRNLTLTKGRLGIVPQYSNLEGELTAWQNLEYHGRLYGISKEERRVRIKELLDFAGLSERAGDKAKTFSGGMQRKLMIVKALMHKPQILLLDEPTVGLDAVSRRKIWDLLKSLNENKMTIFLTTHYLEEAQVLCGKIGMIDNGRIIRSGSPAEIIGSVGCITLEYFRDGETKLKFFDDRDAAVKSAADLKNDFIVRETNLEDVFINITNKGLGAQ